MAAIIGQQKGGLVVARADQLWQLQMVRGTMYGSQNWSRTIRGCHNWSPRTVGGWDQFARDSSFWSFLSFGCAPGVVGFIRVLLLHSRVHLSSFGSFACAQGVFGLIVWLIRARPWGGRVHSGAPRESSGSFGHAAHQQ